MRGLGWQLPILCQAPHQTEGLGLGCWQSWAGATLELCVSLVQHLDAPWGCLGPPDTSANPEYLLISDGG